MTFKILHLADLHLDHPFCGSDYVPSVSRARRDGLRQCLERALAQARTLQVDAITIGGDLYEAEFVSPDTAQFLRAMFQQIAPTPVIIAPGDHDPYTSDSVYACIEWPPNVFIFREPRLTSINLNDEVQLWGIAYDSPEFGRVVLNKFRVPQAQTAVLLMHGTENSLRSPPYAAGSTFSAGDIHRADFQLALCGHVHMTHQIPAMNPLVCFPGSPEPLGFDEDGGHMVLLAEWDERRWSVEAMDLSQWQCRTCSVDVNAFSTAADVVEYFRRFLNAQRKDKQLVMRVILRGTLNYDSPLEVNELTSLLAQESPALRVENHLQVQVAVEGLKDELTMRGSFARRLLAKQSEWQQSDGTAAQPMFDRALRFGLSALEGRKVTL